MYGTLISAGELDALAAKKGALVVVDCRFSLADPDAGELRYAEGHVPGAVYAHLERDLSGPVGSGTGRHPLPDPERFAENLGAWGIDEKRQVVAYDDSGGAIAARLWWMLRWLGHEPVAVLDGGFSAWSAAGLPVTASVEPPEKRRFAPALRPGLAVDAAEVERIRKRGDHRLFDARAPERFSGEKEPIDRVGGHIPGARSLPFAGNLRGGRFLGAAELRQRFAAALGEVPPESAVVYCGSGVTACHNLLAAAHAGFETMRLYPGSFSEWISDEGRPVAKGV